MACGVKLKRAEHGGRTILAENKRRKPRCKLLHQSLRRSIAEVAKNYPIS
jgi:hypothetical protein